MKKKWYQLLDPILKYGPSTYLNDFISWVLLVVEVVVYSPQVPLLVFRNIFIHVNIYVHQISSAVYMNTHHLVIIPQLQRKSYLPEGNLL